MHSSTFFFYWSTLYTVYSVENNFMCTRPSRSLPSAPERRYRWPERRWGEVLRLVHVTWSKRVQRGNNQSGFVHKSEFFGVYAIFARVIKENTSGFALMQVLWDIAVCFLSEFGELCEVQWREALLLCFCFVKGVLECAVDKRRFRILLSKLRYVLYNNLGLFSVLFR